MQSQESPGSVAPSSPVDERALCARLAPAIRAFALRRFRAPTEVDDFVQETLLVLVEAVREGRVPAGIELSAYALGICRNLIRDGSRTRARRDALLGRFSDALASVDEPRPGLVAFERMRMDDCVSRLTTNARTVLKRAFELDESNDEIAVALGLGEGNVRVIRHRSLKFLRECVEHPTSWEAAR